ncbi:MAG: hypothetical protein R2849_15285 [Thermomicrobiales bacterium]
MERGKRLSCLVHVPHHCRLRDLKDQFEFEIHRSEEFVDMVDKIGLIQLTGGHVNAQ